MTPLPECTVFSRPVDACIHCPFHLFDCSTGRKTCTISEGLNLYLVWCYCAPFFAHRFALAHPLVNTEAGLLPDQHHLVMTEAARAKQRQRQLAPLPEPIPVPLNTKVQKIQSIESVLQGMKHKIQVGILDCSSQVNCTLAWLAVGPPLLP